MKRTIRERINEFLDENATKLPDAKTIFIEIKTINNEHHTLELTPDWIDWNEIKGMKK